MKMDKTLSKPSPTKSTIEITAKTQRELSADFATPEFHATLTQAVTADKVLRDELDLKALRAEINRACDEVNAGNMRLPERMALAQAHTLNHLFNCLTQRGFANLGGPWFEPYMRLALRAQAQSARTLETLAALKNPTIFAKQLNVANQQVVSNGGTLPAQTAPRPAELPKSEPIVPLAKTEIPAQAHERMDR